MRLYSTLSRTVEDLLDDDVRAGRRPFGMYVCGPTVQDAPHFGHARAALVPDVLRRVLEHDGVEVLHVANITDVEDKIIAKGLDQGRDPAAVSEEYTRIYIREMTRLNILPPHIRPRATGHIIEMIEMIELLVDAGVAYTVDGGERAIAGSDDVMFRVRGFDGYGALSGRNLDDLRSGARVEADDRKEDPSDFVLWKAAKPGEPSWASPWGPGRPGWHIECSAMAEKYLSDGFDLHAGGADLIFPHHENEIAQAEAATGRPFARVWMHNGLLNIDGEKMSKSLGNFITLADALDEHGGDVIRLYYLQQQYRATAQFSAELLADVRSAWSRITTFVATAPEGGEADRVVVDAALAALRDDLNTPQALSAVFTAIKDGHAALASGDEEAAAGARAAVVEITSLLGLRPVTVGSDGPDVGVLITTLLELRDGARERKDFATADTIRDAIAAAGIVVEDGRDGVRWRLS